MEFREIFGEGGKKGRDLSFFLAEEDCDFTRAPWNFTKSGRRRKKNSIYFLEFREIFREKEKKRGICLSLSLSLPRRKIVISLGEKEKDLQLFLGISRNLERRKKKSTLSWYFAKFGRRRKKNSSLSWNSLEFREIWKEKEKELDSIYFLDFREIFEEKKKELDSILKFFGTSRSLERKKKNSTRNL